MEVLLFFFVMFNGSAYNGDKKYHVVLSFLWDIIISLTQPRIWGFSTEMSAGSL